MDERIEFKFNLESLEKTRHQLNEIQNWASPSNDKNLDLYLIIDNLCRVANMYNMVIRQHVMDGYVTTSDPQSYINAKISTPINIIKRLEEEQQSV